MIQGTRQLEGFVRMNQERGSAARADAFGRLTSARLASLYRLAAAILGDPVEAEDVTHDAAVRAWQRWDSLRDVGRFEAWFQRILINECRDRLRQRHKVVDVAQPRTGLAVSGLSDPGTSVAERLAIAEALEMLTPEQRIVIVLHFYLDLDAEEIAARTGLRLGTVKSRFHYALQALRAAADAVARAEGAT
jgi:RNA polymerase sigma-70 factor (ECF subfamily)